MLELFSKIQYKNFEVGEFVDGKKRRYDETIDLIQNFPWTNQREKIVIDLTNPSITIEGKNNDFLKLAVFFNEKYVLHYLNNERTLFTKSFVDLKDIYKYLTSFFDSATFDTTDFKRENTWLQQNLKHFITQEFHYPLTQKSTTKYLVSTSGINLAYSLFIILLFLIKGFGINNNGAGILFILLSMFFIGGGLNLILFFNYYLYAKDKILIMSKGNDTFYFGNEVSPTKFDKKDIVQFTTIKSSGSRNPVAGFAVVKIEFKDGNEITIPNILINRYTLEQKLFEYLKVDKNGFPFIRT